MMAEPRVLVVDDNPVVRSGLISLLEAAGIEVVAEADDGARAVDLTRRLKPDLVLLDVRMPVMDGVTAAKEISRTVPVMMVTYSEHPATIRAAIGGGAAGYLVYGTFSPQDLVAAVRDAVAGGSPLSPPAASALVGAMRRGRREAAGQERVTPRQAAFDLSSREREVMRLVAQGLPNSEIATRLFLVEKTVKNHLTHIYDKLGVTSRAAAVATWVGSAAGNEH